MVQDGDKFNPDVTVFRNLSANLHCGGYVVTGGERR